MVIESENWDWARVNEGEGLGAQEEQAESEPVCRQRRTGDPRVGDSVGANGAEQERLMHRGQAPTVFAKGKCKTGNT